MVASFEIGDSPVTSRDAARVTTGGAEQTDIGIRVVGIHVISGKPSA